VDAGGARAYTSDDQGIYEEAEVASEEDIMDEIDPILDKISKKGMHSLTDHERKLLDEARKKMR